MSKGGIGKKKFFGRDKAKNEKREKRRQEGGGGGIGPLGQLECRHVMHAESPRLGGTGTGTTEQKFFPLLFLHLPPSLFFSISLSRLALRRRRMKRLRPRRADFSRYGPVLPPSREEGGGGGRYTRHTRGARPRKKTRERAKYRPAISAPERHGAHTTGGPTFIRSRRRLPSPPTFLPDDS